jgi:phosphodiesterase/alkaline phosphatase D-like protein
LPPLNLTAAVTGATQITLQWVDNSSNETGFRIERSTSSNFAAPTVFIPLAANTSNYINTGLAPGQIYYYRVYADGVQGSSVSNVASATVPGAGPTAPSGLTATPSQPGQPTAVVLAWVDNANNEQSYQVERAAGAGVFGLIATLASNSRSYVDTAGLLAGTTYTYRVRAINANAPSAYATSAAVTIGGRVPRAPGFPRILTATRTTITVTWSDLSTDETGFYIERSLDGLTWTRVGQVAANTTRYTDSGLRAVTSYWYRIQAFNASGVSAYTAKVLGRTL